MLLESVSLLAGWEYQYSSCLLWIHQCIFKRHKFLQQAGNRPYCRHWHNFSSQCKCIGLGEATVVQNWSLMYVTEAAVLLEGTFFLLFCCHRTVSSTFPAMIYNGSERIQTCRQLLLLSLELKIWHVNQLTTITGVARSPASTWLNNYRQEHTVHCVSMGFRRANASFLFYRVVCRHVQTSVLVSSVRKEGFTGHQKL